MTQPKKMHIIVFVLAVALAGVPGIALALPDDAQQNMSISADDYIFNVKTSTTTFVGNVVLQQGSLKINASKIVYYGKFDAENPSTTDKIVATGKPARFQQTPKVDTPPVVAQADRLEYSVKDESLFLINNASLDQDGSSLRGDRIEYDVQKALVRASGNQKKDTNNGRIRMVIPPKKLGSIENKEKKSLGNSTSANTVNNENPTDSDEAQQDTLKKEVPESSETKNK